MLELALYIALAAGTSGTSKPATAVLEPTWEDVRQSWYRPTDCTFGDDGGMACTRMLLSFGSVRVILPRERTESLQDAPVTAAAPLQHPEAGEGRLTYYPRFCKPLPGDLRARYVCTAPKGARIRWIPSVKLAVP